METSKNSISIGRVYYLDNLSPETPMRYIGSVKRDGKKVHKFAGHFEFPERSLGNPIGVANIEDTDLLARTQDSSNGNFDLIYTPRNKIELRFLYSDTGTDLHRRLWQRLNDLLLTPVKKL